MYVIRRRIKLANTPLIHEAAVYTKGSEVTYITFCGKKGKYHTRFKRRLSEPLTCKVCLKAQSIRP